MGEFHEVHHPIDGNGNGVAEPLQWVPLTADVFSGGVKSTGTRITTVHTAWAVVDSRASCSYTPLINADGITDGYVYAVRATALLTKLGITEDDLRNGVKSILIGVRQKSDPGLGCNAGVAFGQSSGETGDVATLTGGGGGYRAGGVTSTNIEAMAFDSALEAIGGIFTDIGSTAVVTRYTWARGYVRTQATQQITGDADLGNQVVNNSGFASRTAPIWLILWGGGASANVVDPDMDVYFAVIDGPAFSAVPDV